jgi:hypothetical protein
MSEFSLSLSGGMKSFSARLSASFSVLLSTVLPVLFSVFISVRRGRLPVALLLAPVLVSVPAWAGNFRCDDAELTRAAEQARVRSACFWTGQPLPADWAVACPVVVQTGTGEGSGQTQFQFSGGEVFGWTMQIAGTRTALLEDVLPHEVDHMVRATLVRHPVERWLDEGCSSLMESPESHVRLRTRAAMLFQTAQPDVAWLTARNYPHNDSALELVYVGGFSLVEYLLTCAEPRTLLELQAGTQPMEERLMRCYGLTAAQLLQGWKAWRAQRPALECSQVNCAGHLRGLLGRDVRPQTQGPVLAIWSADWCEGCRKLKADWAQDAGFREALTQSYQVVWHDVDRESVAARQIRIASIPAFLTSTVQVTGYTTADDLLQRLGLSRAKPIVSVPAADSSPSKTPEPVPAPLLPAAETAAPPSSTLSPPASGPGFGGILGGVLPVLVTALQWSGLAGATFATGGIGGAVVAAAMLALRLRALRRTRIQQSEGSAVAMPVPFPRQLDEAGELLELRQSEGRVAVLDALRGLFLDDELEKLETGADAPAAAIARQIRTQIDLRVDEVAPLTTQLQTPASSSGSSTSM